MSNFIVDIFEKTAARFPDRRAVADQTHALSFSELKKLSQQIAGVVQSDTAYIGVMAHRDVYTIAMFFGIAYSGNCYVPIDPDIPAEKMRKIIEDAGITHVLSFDPQDQEKIRASGAKHVLLAPTGFDDAPFTPPAESCRELYIIYTSGSTGVPKGVVKSHQAMKSFIQAYLKTFSFNETTIIGNQTPFCFDASAKDIYLMAACGASLEILPTQLFSFPVRLMAYMNERKVNFICWVPSALTIVTALNTFSEIMPEYLRRVFFVGEVFAAKHLNKWLQALPHVEFVNLYGSSEICGISCFCRISGPMDPTSAIPIGTALSNCDVKLIRDGVPVTDAGITGQIFVASPALADRYYGDPLKTAQSFVSADFGDGTKRYYRTGDLARLDANGQLVFVSRSDHQIKHMGHRIELGEIETAAASLPGIDKCCCLYDSKRSRIILYVQPQVGMSPEAAEIRTALRGILSDYMVPHRVRILEKLPQNANGKIDRLALQKEI